MFKKGDVCLVLPHPAYGELERAFVGKVVTLTVTEIEVPYALSKYGPYWFTEEHGGYRFAEAILQKLEPPSDDEYEKFRNKLDLGVKKDDLVTTD